MTNSNDTTIHYAIGELEGSHDFAADDRMHVRAFASEQERDLWVSGALESPHLMTRGEVRRPADAEEAGEAMWEIEEALLGAGEAAEPAELLEQLSPEDYTESELKAAGHDDAVGRAVATVYDMDGGVLSDGLQVSAVCDAAIQSARKWAEDRGQSVVLEDDDGTWLVAPNGEATEYQWP